MKVLIADDERSITATLGDDFSFLRIDRAAWDLQRFKPGGRPTLRDGYEAFAFTERGVYRPWKRCRMRQT